MAVARRNQILAFHSRESRATENTEDTETEEKEELNRSAGFGAPKAPALGCG
jgi:hypothetical protein